MLVDAAPALFVISDVVDFILRDIAVILCCLRIRLPR
jgi:hypothetical protein